MALDTPSSDPIAKQPWLFRNDYLASDPTTSARFWFENYYNDSSVGEPDTFWTSDFDRRARARGIDEPFFELRCLLDFVFVWMAEGVMFKHIDTFEQYLMAIIAITEASRFSGFLPLERVLRDADDEHDSLDVFYWGKPPRDKTGKLLEDTGGWGWRSPEPIEYGEFLSPDWEGHEHPALSRERFEYYRQQYLMNAERREA